MRRQRIVATISLTEDFSVLCGEGAELILVQIVDVLHIAELPHIVGPKNPKAQCPFIHPIVIDLLL